MSSKLSKPPKPYRISSITRVIALRLPNDVLDIIERRAGKMGIIPMHWLRARICYDVRRKHGKIGEGGLKMAPISGTDALQSKSRRVKRF